MEEKQFFDPRITALLKPQQTAILVIDVMDGFCDPKEPLPKFLHETTGVTFDDLDKAADRLVSFLAQSRSYPFATTVFVRIVERPETMSESIRLRVEINGDPPTDEKDGQGWGYYKVRPFSSDYEIVKYRNDAFMGTDLDAHLKKHNVSTVIVTGGYASICVDTTARTAAQLGYHTFVPADLTADPGLPSEPQTPDVIRKRLDTINSYMGYMPLSSTILSIWENSYNKA